MDFKLWFLPFQPSCKAYSLDHDMSASLMGSCGKELSSTSRKHNDSEVSMVCGSDSLLFYCVAQSHFVMLGYLP